MSILSTGHFDLPEAIGANRYRILLKLGEGGMAEVFLAVQQGITDIRRLVVIKRLRMMFADSDHYQKMFLEEARLASRLNHPNIVHTYEVGQDGNRHFLSMEYLAGHSLHQVLRRMGNSNQEHACIVRVLIEVLKGLEYAHKMRDLDGTPMNLVHRDISPSNIFITYDGRIKILDFGIAKASGSAIETNVGTIKGKLTYMAPEQAKRENVTMQADLYAVGVMLWELAAGRRRWASEFDDVAIFGLLLENRAPEKPGATSRGLPEQMDAICLKALAQNPADRYADAAEFRKELEGLLRLFPIQPTAEDVGAEVAARFESDRERLKQKIDGKIQVSEPPDEEPSASLVWRKPNRERRSLAPTLADDPRAKAAEAAQKGAEAAQKRRVALTAPVVAGIMAIVLGGTALLTWRWSPQEKPRPIVLEAPPEPAQSEVVVTIMASPRNATLFWNDRLLLDNPTIERHPKSEEKITVRAEADGYESEELTVSLKGSSDLVFDLEPIAGHKGTEEGSDEGEAAPKKPAAKTWRPRPRTVSRQPAAKTAPAKVKLDTSDPWAD